MSECQGIGASLDGYHDGELGLLERWRVRRHLAGCGACRDELASLAHFGGWLREAVGDEPQPELWDAIAQRLPAHRPAPERSRARSVPSRRRVLPGLTVTAAAAAIAAAFLVTTSDTGRLASFGGASGVVRSIYANRRPVMVLEAESTDDPTIIWLMDELGEQTPEVSESVGI
jgi:anti-sigma factor RsiW